MLYDLSTDKIQKIQINEGIVVLNLNSANKNVLGPTRGGAEFVVTPTIQDIEFDGRRGKTKGMQLKDSEDISLKINTLDCSQETLALAIPNSTVNASTKEIMQGDFGFIKDENYIDSISVITKTLDNKYKILEVKNAMHEGAFTFKAVDKNQNEHNLEFLGHYTMTEDNKEKIWRVYETDTNPLSATQTQASAK